MLFLLYCLIDIKGFYYFDLTSNTGLWILDNGIPETQDRHIFAKPNPTHYILPLHGIALEFELDMRSFYPTVEVQAHQKENEEELKVFIDWDDPGGVIKATDRLYREKQLASAFKVTARWGSVRGYGSMNSFQIERASSFPFKITVSDRLGKHIVDTSVSLSLKRNGYMVSVNINI